MKIRIFIRRIFLSRKNLLTLNRVVKEGKTYNSTSQEYITNNQEREESSVTLEKYSTDVKETQLRLTFADGIGNTEPELIKPGQIASKEPLTVTLSGGDSGEKFYVYGMGELVAIYDKAGYAIQRANELSGVVIFFQSGICMGERKQRSCVFHGCGCIQ